MATNTNAEKVVNVVKEAAEAILAAGEVVGLKALSNGRSDQYRINPYLLNIKPGWNARDLTAVDNAEHVDELAKSIAAIGVQQPLTVYAEGHKVFVSDGHVRHAATLRAIEVYGAEVKTVPVQTESRGSNEADRILSQITRNSGKPLTPVEKAKVVKQLYDFGWTVEEISAKIGHTVLRVNQLLDLHAAPEAVKALIANGEVSSTLAQQVLNKSGGDGEAALEVLTDAVEAAKAEGKDKATAKHVDGKVTPKVVVKTVGEKLSKPFANVLEDIDDDTAETAEVKIVLTVKDFRELVELLNL